MHGGLTGFKIIMQKIALVAGEGILPIEIARKLFAQNNRILIISLSNNKDIQELRCYSEKFILLRTPALGRSIREIKSWGAEALIMAGRIPKKIIYLFSSIICDSVTRKVLKQSLHDDHSLLGSIVSEYESNGIKVIPYWQIIPEFLAPKGKLTSRLPTQKELQDINYGREILEVILPCSFGQSLIVADGAVVAVEAMEGTDEMIKRAGTLVNHGVLIKMMKKTQDIRYDIPTTGIKTLETMRESGITCLAVESGRTLILEPEKFFEFAERNNIAVWGI